MHRNEWVYFLQLDFYLHSFAENSRMSKASEPFKQSYWDWFVAKLKENHVPKYCETQIPCDIYDKSAKLSLTCQKTQQILQASNIHCSSVNKHMHTNTYMYHVYRSTASTQT